jgi:hypothetical protein
MPFNFIAGIWIDQHSSLGARWPGDKPGDVHLVSQVVADIGKRGERPHDHWVGTNEQIGKEISSNRTVSSGEDHWLMVLSQVAVERQGGVNPMA